MAEPLRFHPLVADDLSAATRWYDKISVDLGNRFRRAISSRLDAIEIRPESFGRVRGELRAAHTKNPNRARKEVSSRARRLSGRFLTGAVRWKVIWYLSTLG